MRIGPFAAAFHVLAADVHLLRAPYLATLLAARVWEERRSYARQPLERRTSGQPTGRRL